MRELRNFWIGIKLGFSFKGLGYMIGVSILITTIKIIVFVIPVIIANKVLG